MKLSSVEMFPGVVIENKDAEGLARLKCSVVSEMDATNVNEKILPWVKPLFGGNNFSVPKKGDKVWVFKNSEALDDYRWAPMYDAPKSVQDYVTKSNSENTHVLMCNDDGYTSSTVTYDDKAGFNLKNGASTFNVGQNTGLNFEDNSSKIKANNNYYEIGQNASEAAVKGYKLRDLLSDLASGLHELSLVAGANPYTSNLAQPLIDISMKLSNAVDDILSSNIKIE